MIGPDYARVMAAYNAEMNRRVYGAAARMPDADAGGPRRVLGLDPRHADPSALGGPAVAARFGVGERPPWRSPTAPR